MEVKSYLIIPVIVALLLGLMPVISGAEAIFAPPKDESAETLKTVEKLMDRGGCRTCHTVPGISGANGKIGPSWCEPALEFQEGKVDLGFIRESIVNPNAEVGAGFPRDTMPRNFGEVFSDKEIDTLATFISTLQCTE